MNFLPGGRKSPTKKFIYQIRSFYIKCNLAEEPLLFSLFKLQFRENVLTERYIAMKNKTARLFNDKWHCFIIKDSVSKIQPLPSPPLFKCSTIKKFVTFIYRVSIVIYYAIIQTVCNICVSFNFVLLQSSLLIILSISCYYF